MLNIKLQFEEVERILKRLGFEEKRVDDTYFFRHNKYNASIALPDTVYSRHLEAIKKMVVDNGITDDQSLDRLLKNAQLHV
ncbi:MAG: hypothetical protein ACXVPK_12380 [Tumebacillaceae bacterium]